MSTAKQNALATRTKKYEERAKYFNGKGGREKWNGLTSEGRARSGVDFSYGKQKFVSGGKKGSVYAGHSKKDNLKYLGHSK